MKYRGRKTLSEEDQALWDMVKKTYGTPTSGEPEPRTPSDP